MDYYLLQVTRDSEVTVKANGSLKKGYAVIKFLDFRGIDKPEQETYDLRGLGSHHTKFVNWTKREFGYLRYSVEFGK